MADEIKDDLGASDGKIPVAENDIVQLDPETTENKQFAGCLMTVTDVKEWGVQGYVQNAGATGQAYYRAVWGTFEQTGGKAVWSVHYGE